MASNITELQVVKVAEKISSDSGQFHFTHYLNLSRPALCYESDAGTQKIITVNTAKTILGVKQ